MDSPRVEDLIIFMAFAGNEDDISRLGQFDSPVNGLTAVDNDFVLLARMQAFFDTGFYFSDNGVGVFRTGIV